MAHFIATPKLAVILLAVLILRTVDRFPRRLPACRYTGGMFRLRFGIPSMLLITLWVAGCMAAIQGIGLFWYYCILVPPAGVIGTFNGKTMLGYSCGFVAATSLVLFSYYFSHIL